MAGEEYGANAVPGEFGGRPRLDRVGARSGYSMKWVV